MNDNKEHREMYRRIGERIKRLRRNKNMNQQQLADCAELSLQYISKIERGLTPKSISTETIFKIAKALGVKNCFLLTDGTCQEYMRCESELHLDE